MSAGRDRGALRALTQQIADAIQAHGRKASSGEPLFFDRFNLERIISDQLEAALGGVGPKGPEPK